MRVTSTLHPPEEFYMAPVELKNNGFAAFYLGDFDKSGGGAHELATKMFLAAFMPWSRDIKDYPTPKNYKDFIKKVIRYNDRQYQMAVTAKLSRNVSNKTFNLVSTFAWAEGTGPAKDFQHWCLDQIGAKLSPEQRIQKQEEFGELNTASMTGAQFSEFVPTSARNKALLKQAIAHVLPVVDESGCRLKIQWVIPKNVAEYINSTAYLEIKLGNFYQLLIDWLMSCFARDGRVAKFSTPIAKVSQSIKIHKKTAPVRASTDGLVVNQKAEFFYIPEVDQSVEYEQELQTFGEQADGSYTMDPKIDLDQIDINNPNPSPPKRPKLPANMPILTDWVNGKFAYSNTLGRLAVMDLEETSPVKPHHIKEFLDQKVVAGNELKTMGMLGNALTLCLSMGLDGISNGPKDDEWDGEDRRREIYENRAKGGGDINRMLNAATSCVMWKPPREEGQSIQVYAESAPYLGLVDRVNNIIPLQYFSSASPIGPLRWFGRLVTASSNFLEKNLDAAYRQYSVGRVLEMVAVLRMFTRYADKFADLEAADAQERNAYINQGVDKNYKVQPLPLVRHGPNEGDGLNIMPHQAKAENLLRNDPDFAVLDVDAGGGKTIIILKDVIKSLANGQCKRPIVLCPAHLVSQYVKEVVYLTSGRLNIVPFTNVSMEMHGEEGLTKMVEKAPINTVFVTDMNFIKARPTDVAYGNKSVRLFRNVEFMRSLEFDMIFVDESQYLANSNSTRRQAAAKFMLDIKKKRIASGTLVHNTITDLVSQFALFDPTIFGDIRTFNNTYAATTNEDGSKALSWIPGAEAIIHRKMEEHAVFCTGRRKEWAALLPNAKEKFYFVDLTGNQRKLYQDILDETTAKIEEAMAKNKELKELMESDDDTKAEQLEAILKPYLVRMERFLSAPEQDKAGTFILQNPEDRVSPKVNQIYKCIDAHFKLGIPGKVLIFTNYVAAAESVYDNAPPELKEQMILYTAGNKMECRAAFEKNDKMRIMVGVSSSMDTGLNFQHVSRLIRMETLWTPGGLEQGNSRVNRPQLKKLEERKDIFFDWIVVNRTVDVTKVSRLISKVISKAKFDNSSDPAYQSIDPEGLLPPISMSLESINARNDFADDLLDYLQGYEQLQQVRQNDEDAYRKAHPELVMQAVPSAGLIPGSKLMSRVPYVPDMEVYGASQLGLVRLDEYMRQDAATGADDEDDVPAEVPELPTHNARGEELLTEAERKKEAMRLAYNNETAKLKNQPVWTEYGQGTFKMVGTKRAKVVFSNGEEMMIPKMQIFVITRPTTNGIDLRNELLKQVGDVPFDKPVSVPVEKGPLAKKKAADAEEQQEVQDKKSGKKSSSMDVQFTLTVINDHLAIQPLEADDNVLAALTNFGFKMSPKYYYALVKQPPQLLKLFETWRAKKFVFGKQAEIRFTALYKVMKGQRRALEQFGVANVLELKNYFVRPFPPTTNPKEINPFPQIQDGKLLVCLMIKGQAGSKPATAIRPDGINWRVGGGEGEYLRFCRSKPEAKQVLKQIKDAGFNITNLDDIGKQYNMMKVVDRSKEKNAE